MSDVSVRLTVDDIDRIVAALAGSELNTPEDLAARLAIALKLAELKQRSHQSPPPHVAVEPKATKTAGDIIAAPPLSHDERMDLIRRRVNE